MDPPFDDLIRTAFERLKTNGLARLRHGGQRFRGLSHLGLMQVAERAVAALAILSAGHDPKAVEVWASSLANWMQRHSVRAAEAVRTLELLGEGLCGKVEHLSISSAAKFEGYGAIDGGVARLVRILEKAVQAAADRKERTFRTLTVQLIGLSSFARAAQLTLQAARTLVDAQATGMVFFGRNGAESVVETWAANDDARVRLHAALANRCTSAGSAAVAAALQTDELFVPMMHRGRTVGELALVGKRRGRRFTADDSKWAGMLADHAAAALASARLRDRDKRRWEEATVINAYSQKAGFASNIGELMALFFRQLRRVAPFERGAVLVAHKDRAELYLDGPLPAESSFLDEFRLRATAACERFGGKTLPVAHVSAVSAGPTTQLHPDEPANYFEFPLLLPPHRELAGMLVLATPAHRPLSLSKRRFVASFAAHSSQSIQRLRSARSAERRRLEAVVERLHDGVVLLDAARRVSVANATARRILAIDGVVDADNVLRGVGRWTLDELLESVGQGFDQPRTLTCPRGSPIDARHFEIAPQSVGPRHAPRAFLVLFRDITAWVRAQDEIRYAKRFEEVMVDTAPAVVLALDAAGRVVRANALAEEYTGVASADLVHTDWFDRFVAEPDRQALRAAFDKVADGDRLRGERAALLTAAGRTRPFAWWASALPPRVADGAVVMIGHDLAPLAEAQERALQAERLAAIGEMTTGLSHESRNALQRSQAALERMQFRIDERPELADLAPLVAQLQEAQDYLVCLYDEVRDYAAPLRLRRQEVCLSEILQRAWSNLALDRESRNAALEERVEASTRLAADPTKMLQTFRNILENSLAASVARPATRLLATYRDVRSDGQPWLRISIQDDGPGFTGDAREKIFQPFFTTKRQGTGLGMPIVKRIVETHGGRVELGAGPAELPGAEVVVWLPRATA